jgi:hypothetical protein
MDRLSADMGCFFASGRHAFRAHARGDLDILTLVRLGSAAKQAIELRPAEVSARATKNVSKLTTAKKNA